MVETMEEKELYKKMSEKNEKLSTDYIINKTIDTQEYRKQSKELDNWYKEELKKLFDKAA